MDNNISLWQISGNKSPPTSTHNDIQFYRNALSNGQSYLHQQFEQGKDVVILVQQRAIFVDQALRQLWQQYVDSDTLACLIAVGGYGRSELHPYSDIDLLLLLDESISDNPPEALSDFLTQLWDMGLEIGHSVRNLKECRQLAEEDISIATNLLEARHLCGEVELFSKLQQLTVSNKTWDTKRFFHDKKTEQLQRHKKYNDTANNLEPNIKESPGGLRDIQVISWIAQQHVGVKDLNGLKEKGFLAESEYQTLIGAQDFLWKIRFALHTVAGRKEEKLMIDHQRTLAKQFGYQDTSSRLAVEQFMKAYYLCARAVGQMNSLLLQLFEESIVLADEEKLITPINRRFQVHNGYLETMNSAIFAFHPFSMLELFLILEQHPEIKGVRAATIRQLHAHIHLIGDQFRADIKNRSLFMEIIRQPKGITHEFRRMNQLGVLGAYLPNFGQIVGQMQHDLFHAYTVDEHTLFLVRNLRRFSCTEFYDEFPLCSEVFHQIPKPELLYIAGIFHDIAKGRGGNHSELGVFDARDFCHRHSLSEHDTDLVTWLVLSHLKMSATAQRCDINDPEIIHSFAKTVGTVERLNYLYLLTVADIRATNNSLWNSWRDSLLRLLYRSTRHWLEHDQEKILSLTAQSEQAKAKALKKLLQLDLPAEQIEALWQHYEQHYFLHHTVKEIIWHTQCRLQHTGSMPLVNIRSIGESDTLEILLVSSDQAGLFAAITATLEQLQLDILDAKLDTTSSNQAINTFIVGDTESQRTERETEIKEALLERLNHLEESKAYCPVITPRKMKLFKSIPDITFQTNPEHTHTIIDINTHDRPGLISSIAQVFLQCNIQLITAKLTILGDQVENVFFITTMDKEILNNEQKAILQKALEKTLTS